MPPLNVMASRTARFWPHVLDDYKRRLLPSRGLDETTRPLRRNFHEILTGEVLAPQTTSSRARRSKRGIERLSPGSHAQVRLPRPPHRRLERQARRNRVIWYPDKLECPEKPCWDGSESNQWPVSRMLQSRAPRLGTAPLGNSARGRRHGPRIAREGLRKQPRPITAEPIDNGIPGWTTVPLGLVVVDPIYGTPKKCGYGTGATGVLRIPNIGSGRIDTTDLKSADFDETESARFSLQEGDILTVRSNGSLPIVGKAAMVRHRHTDYLFAGYLIRLRPIVQSLVPKYLVYMLMEPRVRAQIETKAKSTSGVNNISAKELQELNAPICCPEEQAEIVRILDARLEAAEIVDAEIDVNLARAEALRQSILKKAFAGKLVPQDPDDEPAQALLARIRSSRSEDSTTRPRRRARRRASATASP